MEKETKVVKNTSKAYGYNYASLGDIANQGYEIPKMKTGTEYSMGAEQSKEFVYYYDKDLNEWIRGAEIVVPENIISKDGKNKMNSAQLYGSALTYARRYTTLMALSLCCDDDKNLEATMPKEEKQKSGIFDEPIPHTNVKDMANEFRKLYTQEEQTRIMNGLKVTKAEDIGMHDLEKYINFAKYGKK